MATPSILSSWLEGTMAELCVKLSDDLRNAKPQQHIQLQADPLAGPYALKNIKKPHGLPGPVFKSFFGGFGLYMFFGGGLGAEDVGV